MHLTRLFACATLAGCTFVAPLAFADDAAPAPAPPSSPDDLGRAIREAERKIEEARAAGREREEAQLREALERLRRAKQVAGEVRARMLEEEKGRSDRDATPGPRVRVILDEHGKLQLDGGPDGGAREREAQVAALRQAHEQLLTQLRAAEQAGNKEEVERLREKASAVDSKIRTLWLARQGKDRDGSVHFYPKLEFGGDGPEGATATLDRRLAALRQASKALREGGLEDQARGLQADAERLERERAAIRAAKRGGAQGRDSAALEQEVRALREQVEGLRHELREVRALLERVLATK